jgi:hypothetical protein
MKTRESIPAPCILPHTYFSTSGPFKVDLYMFCSVLYTPSYLSALKCDTTILCSVA